jgi:predicted DNA-binding transcriptional regulator AlpA
VDTINRSGNIDVDALIHALKDALTRPEVIALLSINLSPLKVLTRAQVIALLGFSKTTFDRLEAKGLGPPKIKLADRRIGYRVCDLQLWGDARLEKSAARLEKSAA